MSGPARAILEIRDLTVRFGALVAVKEVSFDVERGHITSVIGPNGAGKSTLFNLVSGAVRPLEGTVTFDGQDITGATPQRLARKGLSRSFQITNLFADLSVEENLRLAAQVLEPPSRSLRPARSSTVARGRVEELVEQFGLADRTTELAGYLSHGEQRRLEIAVAVAWWRREERAGGGIAGAGVRNAVANVPPIVRSNRSTPVARRKPIRTRMS